MRRCELCKAKAWMHCESDKASLCWDCDAAVHSANFLVARHSRNLLCRVCHSPTPWSASGGKLRPTVSFCEQCVDQERYDDSSEEGSVEAAEEEEMEDSRIIPWSPPPCDDELDSDEDVVPKKLLRSEKVQMMDSGRIEVCGLHREDTDSGQETHQISSGSCTDKLAI